MSEVELSSQVFEPTSQDFGKIIVLDDDLENELEYSEEDPDLMAERFREVNKTFGRSSSGGLKLLIPMSNNISEESIEELKM